MVVVIHVCRTLAPRQRLNPLLSLLLGLDDGDEEEGEASSDEESSSGSTASTSSSDAVSRTNVPLRLR